MAHNPALTQTKLRDNSTLHYYVSPAPFRKEGALLYNPKTKKTIIRRTFKSLDATDQILTSLPLSTANDQDPIPDPYIWIYIWIWTNS